MAKSDYKDMWVYIEHDGEKIETVSLELCCQIRKLADDAGEKLAAVIVGSLPEAELERVLDCGADSLMLVEGKGLEPFSLDAYTALFTWLCRKYKPSAVFVGGTINGRDLAPRFACRLPTGCTSDATELVYDKETGDIEFIEPAVGGKMMAVITVPQMRPQVGTLRPGTFKYSPGGRRDCRRLHERFDFDAANIRTSVLGFQPVQDEGESLADAEVVVCVGNAVKADSMPLYRELADKLGGGLGCTRPVFDRGLLPYKQVIGQSGLVVKPRLLLSFGVSGAVNHVTGIADAEKIVAVNTDPEAAIFLYSDLGIVGDMDQICRLLLEKL